jgi:hypothetical protein
LENRQRSRRQSRKSKAKQPCAVKAKSLAKWKKPILNIEILEGVKHIAFGFLKVYRKRAGGILAFVDHKNMISPRIEVY